MLWTKIMEGGIPVVDAQHKELFRQVDALLNNGGEEEVCRMLQFLEQYVVRHFATEEYMQQSAGYPLARLHKKQHNDFTAAFLELKKEYQDSGYNLVVLLKLNRTAVAWLKEHILGADKEFADYYAGKFCTVV